MRGTPLFPEAEGVRIDASVSFPPGRTPEQLHRILERNRFEAAIARGEPFDGAPDWIRGWIGAAETDHPGLVAIECVWPDTASAEFAARRNLVADVICTPPQLETLAAFAAAHPDARIVAARTAGAAFGPEPDPVWIRGIETLAAVPNVYLKFDGILAGAPPGDPDGWGPSSVRWNADDYRPWIQFALRTFGAGRCLYGSGWPERTAAGTWKEALACFTQALGAQTMEARERIFGETAERVYLLPRGL